MCDGEQLNNSGVPVHSSVMLTSQSQNSRHGCSIDHLMTAAAMVWIRVDFSQEAAGIMALSYL